MVRQPIIAHHLIWTLYGHWLPNDLRGSGSAEIRQERFSPLGPVHHGRKPSHLQPSREELRAFQERARPLLASSRFWIDDRLRDVLAESFGDVIRKHNYTVWACAILKNHVHLVIRKHRDDALTMWHKLADASRGKVVDAVGLPADHRVWASRPYKVFLRTPEEVWTRIRYVERNPEKEGLAKQDYEFVKSYDNWPFHKK